MMLDPAEKQPDATSIETPGDKTSNTAVVASMINRIWNTRGKSMERQSPYTHQNVAVKNKMPMTRQDTSIVGS